MASGFRSPLEILFVDGGWTEADVMEETSFLRCVERKDKSGRFGESPKPSLSQLVSKGLQDAAKVMNCLFFHFFMSRWRRIKRE